VSTLNVFRVDKQTDIVLISTFVFRMESILHFMMIDKDLKTSTFRVVQ